MLTYEQSGVNIDEGNRAVSLIKGKIKETYDKNVIGDLGNFSGLYSLKDFMKMEEPVLLAATDGVGTKLKLAQMMDKHNTVGIDLVAMSVNDLICQGAKPLLFLDYIAIGKLVPEHIDQIVAGVANGCKMSGCALIGGETAEMPGMYSEEEYDLAGFAVGIADKTKIVSGKDVKAGDVLVGVSSSGIHSNGFSFIRKIFLDTYNYDLNQYIEELKMTVGEALLTPTKIYVKLVLDLLEKYNIHTEQGNGVYCDDNPEHTTNHAWLIVNGESYIDITATQFMFCGAFKKDIYVGRSFYFYEELEDVKIYRNCDITRDKRLWKDYQIIMEYLPDDL